MIINALRSPQRSTDGFIIVAALWIIAALATLASIYAVYLNNTTQAFAENDDRIRAEATISASLSLTAYQLLSQEKENPSTRGRFNFHLGRANVTVDFVSEATRIDLNAAPEELLAGLFIALGASNDAASVYADRIVEWRTPPDNPRNNDALSNYQNAGLTHGPRQAPFASVSELWLVRDLPQEMIERAIPYVTVFNGEPGIDLLDATPTVIAALPGMTPDQVKAVLDQRLAAPQDEQAIRALLGPSQIQFVSSKSTATRTTIHINFNNGRKVEAEAVIKLADAERTPYRVLFWRDELDGSIRGPAGAPQ